MIFHREFCEDQQNLKQKIVENVSFFIILSFTIHIGMWYIHYFQYQYSGSEHRQRIQNNKTPGYLSLVLGPPFTNSDPITFVNLPPGFYICKTMSQLSGHQGLHESVCVVFRLALKHRKAGDVSRERGGGAGHAQPGCQSIGGDESWPQKVNVVSQGQCLLLLNMMEKFITPGSCPSYPVLGRQGDTSYPGSV